MDDREVMCWFEGSPSWWRDYNLFHCELPKGHEGDHRQTIEWDDNWLGMSSND